VRTARSVAAGSEPGSSWLSARPALFAAVALLAVGAWAYSTSFAGVFVFDDLRAIVENPNLRQLWPLTQSMSAPRDVTVSGRPVASLTLALNYALAPADARAVMAPVGPSAAPDAADRFYRNVWGYHALNFIVHWLAALALFGVVRRTLLAPRLRAHFGDASAWLAGAVALLWLVHPLHTQAVTYVVQRVESLMGLFYLCTLYCAIRAAAQAPRRTFWVCGAIAACALGMGCKEVMVTAPIMVWLWDFIFVDGNRKSRLPLYAGLAATWIILAALVLSNPRPNSAGFSLGAWTWWSYLRTQAGVLTHYLKLAIVPSPLVFDYGWPQARSFGEIAPQAAFLAALVILTTAALIRRRPIGFAGAWFFLILAPTSSILPIPTEVAAEHRMYLPVAAVISLAVLCVFFLGRRLEKAITSKIPLARRFVVFAGLILTCAISGAFAALTHARNRDCWSNESLMRDTVQKRPMNARVRIGYGVALLSERRYPEAESQLRIAVGLDAGSLAIAQAHMYLGAALCGQNKLEEGIPHLNQALALDPTLKEADAFLGEAYAGQGNLTLAMKHFMSALDALPDNPSMLNRVAWLFATSPQDDIRNGPKAVELAERAVRLTGRKDVIALDTLASAYAEVERFADAIAAMREALMLAHAQDYKDLIPEFEQRLALYQSGRKMREPAIRSSAGPLPPRSK
jgi:tetratricopeptide (TPR) repeat protein